ncbi:MAG: hypothetical protein R3C28_08740 [Pirellulaceae bacterium]
MKQRLIRYFAGIACSSAMVVTLALVTTASGQSNSVAADRTAEPLPPGEITMDNDPPPAPPFSISQPPTRSSLTIRTQRSAVEAASERMGILQKRLDSLDEAEELEIEKLQGRLQLLRQVMNRQRREMQDAAKREALLKQKNAQVMLELQARQRLLDSTAEETVVVPVFPKDKSEPPPVPPNFPQPESDAEKIEAQLVDTGDDANTETDSSATDQTSAEETALAQDNTDSSDVETMQVAKPESVVDSQILNQVAETSDDPTTVELPGNPEGDTDVPPPQPITSGAVDSMLLADNLFGDAKYKLALEVYLKMAATQLTDDERTWVTYQVACCSEHLGDLDTAEKNFRTVVNNKEAKNLAGMAQWRLGLIDHHRKLQVHLSSLENFLDSVREEFPHE